MIEIQGSSIYQLTPSVKVELAPVQLHVPGEDDRIEHRVIMHADRLDLTAAQPGSRAHGGRPGVRGNQVDLLIINRALEANKATIRAEIAPLQKLAAQRLRQSTVNTAEGSVLGAAVGGAVSGVFKAAPAGPVAAGWGAVAGAALGLGFAYKRSRENVATLKTLRDVQSVLDLYDRYAEGVFDEETLLRELIALRQRSKHFAACGKTAMAELDRQLLSNGDPVIVHVMEMYHRAKNTAELYEAQTS